MFNAVDAFISDKGRLQLTARVLASQLHDLVAHAEFIDKGNCVGRQRRYVIIMSEDDVIDISVSQPRDSLGCGWQAVLRKYMKTAFMDPMTLKSILPLQRIFAGFPLAIGSLRKSCQSSSSHHSPSESIRIHA